jgi:hypothetical protein
LHRIPHDGQIWHNPDPLACSNKGGKLHLDKEQAFIRIIFGILSYVILL